MFLQEPGFRSLTWPDYLIRFRFILKMDKCQKTKYRKKHHQMVLVRGSLVVVKNLVSIYHSFFTFWIFRPKHTVGPGRYKYSKTSKDNSQMILITSFFKSFKFELNPIPKTDFLKENFEVIISILYPYHIPYSQILETSSKHMVAQTVFWKTHPFFRYFNCWKIQFLYHFRIQRRALHIGPCQAPKF